MKVHYVVESRPASVRLSPSELAEERLLRETGHTPVRRRLADVAVAKFFRREDAERHLAQLPVSPSLFEVVEAEERAEDQHAAHLDPFPAWEPAGTRVRVDLDFVAMTPKGPEEKAFEFDAGEDSAELTWEGPIVEVDVHVGEDEPSEEPDPCAST